MTMPADYNQQLYAYLQAWRQLLESAAALAAAMPMPMPMPGVVPGLAPMPPTSAAPPTFAANNNPTQQLFGHLQAWRQYLEQMVGQADKSQGGPDETTTAHVTPPPRPTEPVPPKDPNVGRTGVHDTSGSAGPRVPPEVRMNAPRNPFGGQVPVEGALRAPADRQAAVAARGQQIPRPPALEFGQQITPLRSRVEPSATTLPATDFGALFKGLIERTPGVG